ncbi:MAG TPA: pentapeptide repeat-containing protein [Actinomycetales bacterium]|nr:pentapeptide repeat-containing protein [Actinomycetales bacterium]
MADNEGVVGRTFSGEDWYGRDLSGRRFEECTFLDVDLTETTSAGALFERCRFAGVRLNASRHEGTGFVQCSFENVSWFDAELVGCKLLGSQFTRCSLRPLRGRGGSWSFVQLAGADLGGLDLQGVQLVEADLSEADLSGASLRDCDLSRADLRAARLDGADLRGTSLHGVDPLGPRWGGARLDLSQAVTLAEALGTVVEL